MKHLIVTLVTAVLFFSSYSRVIALESRQVTNTEISNLSFASAMQLHSSWEVENMYVQMPTELYAEISYKLVNAEIVVYDDGSAELLGLCREVSDELRDALSKQINLWNLRPRTKNAPVSRLIFEVPAPQKSGAFLFCDSDWYPNERAFNQSTLDRVIMN